MLQPSPKLQIMDDNGFKKTWINNVADYLAEILKLQLEPTFQRFDSFWLFLTCVPYSQPMLLGIELDIKTSNCGANRTKIGCLKPAFLLDLFFVWQKQKTPYAMYHTAAVLFIFSDLSLNFTFSWWNWRPNPVPGLRSEVVPQHWLMAMAAAAKRKRDGLGVLGGRWAECQGSGGVRIGPQFWGNFIIRNWLSDIGIS